MHSGKGKKKKKKVIGYLGIGSRPSFDFYLDDTAYILSTWVFVPYKSDIFLDFTTQTQQELQVICSNL